MSPPGCHVGSCWIGGVASRFCASNQSMDQSNFGKPVKSIVLERLLILDFSRLRSSGCSVYPSTKKVDLSLQPSTFGRLRIQTFKRPIKHVCRLFVPILPIKCGFEESRKNNRLRTQTN